MITSRVMSVPTLPTPWATRPAVSQPPPAPSSQKHAAPPAASPIPSRVLRKITVLVEHIVRSYSTVVEQIRDRMLSAPDASW